jgi:thioredoxin 1
MKHGFFWMLVLAAACSYGQYGSAGGYEQTAFDSSDIIADRIVKSPVPVVLDFSAVWCKPCRMLAPIIEELKKKYAGKIKVIKIDIDANRRIASYFRVTSIPAVFFVKDKAVVLYLPGLQEKSVYEQAITEVLKPKTPEAPRKDSLTSAPSKKQP